MDEAGLVIGFVIIRGDRKRKLLIMSNLEARGVEPLVVQHLSEVEGQGSGDRPNHDDLLSWQLEQLCAVS